jgi:hypothetical protein
MFESCRSYKFCRVAITAIVGDGKMSALSQDSWALFRTGSRIHQDIISFTMAQHIVHYSAALCFVNSRRGCGDTTTARCEPVCSQLYPQNEDC